MAYDEYGNRTRECFYDAGGALEWRRVSRYDENGRRTSHDIYDGEGNLAQSITNN